MADGAADKRDSRPARHEAQNGGFIHRFLDDVRRFEAAAKTFMHQPIVEGRTFPSRKPHKSSVAQIAQPNLFQFGQRMSPGHGQHQIERGDGELRQSRPIGAMAKFVADVRQLPEVQAFSNR